MRRLPALVLSVGLVLGLAVSTGVSPAGAAAPGTTTTAAPPVVPRLVAIRAAHHPGKDRVVFEFAGGLPRSRTVGYVDRLIGDGSGLPVRIAGRALLQVRFADAEAHDSAGRETAPGRVAYALPNVMTVVRSGDFEAVTTYGVGLTSRQPFRVFTLTGPPRVVIDVDASFRTVPRRVWFFDERRFVAGTEPYFRSVTRPVLPMLPATTLLHRVYAGPTPAEQRAGLRLLLSGSTGFTALSVADGVARVRLTGGCSSGGSTVTVAGHLLPTLKQLPQVDVVKVFDPQGRTERPTGRVDSIPACLEP